VTSPISLLVASASARRLIVCALLVLVPLQTSVASVAATRGPLHAHRAADVVVLEDVRRVAHGAESVHPSAPHRHGLVAERHRHASADRSVLAVDDPWAAADAASAALAGQPALCAAVAGWRSDVLADVRRAAPAWAPCTHHPPPLEHPPRYA
jgi:hypothetical protein